MRALPPLGHEHARGRLGADDERAADGAALVEDGRVAVGPVDLFDAAVAEDRDELILVPARLPRLITSSICGQMIGQISCQQSAPRCPIAAGCLPAPKLGR